MRGINSVVIIIIIILVYDSILLLKQPVPITAKAIYNLQGDITQIGPSGDIKTLTPTYSWTKGPGTGHYRLLVSESADGRGAATYFPSETSFTSPVALSLATTYYWWVRQEYSTEYVGPMSFKTPTSQPPSITVLSPNGGESWQYGATNQIRFSANFASNRIGISIFKGSNVVYDFGDQFSSSGTIDFFLDQKYQSAIGTGNDYRIRVYDNVISYPDSVRDDSDSTFSIMAPMKVTDSQRRDDKNKIILALTSVFKATGSWPKIASGGMWACLAPSSETCWGGAYRGDDTIVQALAPYLSTIPKPDFPIDTLPYNAYIYAPNYPGIGGNAQGAYLVWYQHSGMDDSICPYYITNHETYYWFCYERIGSVSSAPSITVTSPNGGETWTVGSMQIIKWTSINLPSDQKIDVIRLRDAYGIEIIILLGTINDGFEQVVVPPLLEGAYTLEIEAYSSSGAFVFDASDRAFSIVSVVTPSITVLSPKLGEQWQTGTTQTIRWISENYPADANVRIVLLQESPDNIKPPEELQYIAPATVNDGVETWTIPSTLSPASNYLIGVSCTPVLPAPGCFAKNSWAFSIVVQNVSLPIITVLSPNGGEVWKKGDKQVIKWFASKEIPYVDIILKSAPCIARACPDFPPPVYFPIAKKVPNNGLFEWTVPSTIPGGEYHEKYIIEIVDSAGPKVFDQSDAPFSIISKAICGNNVCEEGEADDCPIIECKIGESCPQMASCYQGTCPRDCKTNEFDLRLSKGWNLISSPVYERLEPYRDGTAFANFKTDCIYSSPLWMYLNTENAYIKSRYITADRSAGYWIKVKNDCTVKIKGDGVYTLDSLFKSGTLKIKKGWNIIGGTPESIEFSRIRGSCKFVRGPYWYNPAFRQYWKEELMEPGKGYILRVEDDCELKEVEENPPELPPETTGKVVRRG